MQAPNNVPGRLLGYARVSTGEQNLARQIKALVEYGCPPKLITKEYASGGTMNRPEFNSVLKASHPGDTIVVLSLDRFGRTVSGVIKTIESLKFKGVEVVSLKENIDTTSAIGKMFFQIIAVFAEFERNLISERTKSGMAIKRAEGVQFGRKHSIQSNPKRLAAMREELETGRLLDMRPAMALLILNMADPKARPITSVETFRRWRAKGFAGID